MPCCPHSDEHSPTYSGSGSELLLLTALLTPNVWVFLHTKQFSNCLQTQLGVQQLGSFLTLTAGVNVDPQIKGSAPLQMPATSSRLSPALTNWP